MHGGEHFKNDILINKVAVGVGDLTKSLRPSERLSILPFHTILVPSEDIMQEQLGYLPLDHSATVKRAMKYFVWWKAGVTLRNRVAASKKGYKVGFFIIRENKFQA